MKQGGEQNRSPKNHYEMLFHGNDLRSLKEHHLYAIHDQEENDIFKYGLSDNPIRENGTSRRMREQVTYLNSAVGWMRYFSEILLRNIAGKAKAEEIENEHIAAYRKQHGRNPRGNKEKIKNA